MPAEFVAYIDESGDEGFNFDAGSSEWFVLSAVIVEKAHDVQIVKLLDEVRSILKLPPRKVLHFRKLRHDQRLPYVHAIARATLCATTVFVHKPSIRNQETFRAPHRLYFYTTRYLLERISWYCAANRRGGRDGSGHVELVFSNRSTMPYDDLADYLRYLCQGRRFDPTLSLDRAVIRHDEMATYIPSERMGLQVADAVASSFYFAVTSDVHGFTEPRYATMLRPVVYCRGAKYTSYGLKFVPSDGKATFDADGRLEWMRTY